jgi:hypothetical protein
VDGYFGYIRECFLGKTDGEGFQPNKKDKYLKYFGFIGELKRREVR